jgi:protein translocase SecG subunit
MRIVLIVLMIAAGIVFVGSVLLMSPKGGIGLGIGGLSGGSDYGSKKSLETNLKKVAVISVVIFVLIALVLPYTLRG